MPAGSATRSTAFIFITPPSCFISWISTTLAVGDAAATSAMSASDVRCMKAPVAFCPATVPRTQASVTATCAAAGTATSATSAAATKDERR